ncbi:MAG: FkbM family methyltransferase [Sphingomonadales bacterium]|nr:FkbM family methyltransferase [Sphingomonadales bacterium]
MRLFLEISFRGVYYWLTDPMYRVFIGLVIRYGDQKRNRPRRIRVLGHLWKVLDAYSFIWQFREIFTDRSYAFPCNGPNPVIYDCGSNIGLSILYYNKYYPNSRIECFEPNPRVAEVLKQNIVDLKGCTINLHREAAWIRDEMLEFAVEGDPDAGRIGDSSMGGAGTVQVQARDLRTLLDRESRIDFLKMDVEGAESLIVPHIAQCLHKVQSLFVEYHSRPNDPQDLGSILRCLEDAGYRYYLKTENRRRQPLTNHGQELAMDYQTNVYAFRLGS